MRTNIDIDDALMAQALAAGPYQTKREAVEAGLRLLARQAHYREILRWRGKLAWEAEDAAPRWGQAAPAGGTDMVQDTAVAPVGRRGGRDAGR